MSITTTFPYIKLDLDLSNLAPRAQRADGNIAIVGNSGGFGTAAANVPVMIGSSQEARTLLANVNPVTGAVSNSGPLFDSVMTALIQDPGPSRIYAVPTGDDGAGAPDYAAALASLATAPVQFVGLAAETDPDAIAVLGDHIESVSADGKRRMGVAMVDPATLTPDNPTLGADIAAAYNDALSPTGRMILMAARIETTASGAPVVDLGAAAMSATAGYAPHISILLKQIRGISIPLQDQFTGSEIASLDEAFVIPVIDPELIVGPGLHFGGARTFTSDPARMYPDVVRVVDKIEFDLKSGLIGSIGNSRIDRLGLQSLQGRITGILEPLQTARIIDDFSVSIPLKAILEADEASRTPGQTNTVSTARTTRVVEVMLSVTYAGSIHFLALNLALK